MGVDFYTCPVCEHTFPDCGEFERCGHCGKAFCSDECAKVECHCNEDKEDPHEHEDCDEDCKGCSCVLCREEIIQDGSLVKFLLRRCGLTRKEAEKEYRKHGKQRRGKGNS